MQKAISIEQTSSNIAAVLSIAPPEVGTEWQGRQYIIIDDYTEPELTDPMDKAYPVYDKTAKRFFYVIEKWTETIQQDRLDMLNLKQQYEQVIKDAKATTAELEKLKADHLKAIAELTNMIAQMSVPQVP